MTRAHQAEMLANLLPKRQAGVTSAGFDVITRTATASVAEGTGSAKTAFTPVVLPSTTPSVSDIGASLMDSLTEPFEGLSLAAKIGLAVGTLAAVILLITLVALLVKRCMRRSYDPEDDVPPLCPAKEFEFRATKLPTRRSSRRRSSYKFLEK